MSNGDSLVHEFFDEQTVADTQQALDNASSYEKVALAVSGRYRMKVDTFAYVKDGKENKFPDFQRSANKGVLQLVLPLRVVDGTEQVPKGAMLFHSLNMAPEKGAPKEKLQTMARMAKPTLVALLGHENIQAGPQWLLDNLIPTFDRNEDDMTLKKDHKLKNEVMVVVEDDWYNNKPKLKVVSVQPAQPGEKSVSNKPKEPVDTGGKDPTDIDYTNVADADIVDAEKIADEAVKEAEGTGSPDLKAKTEDF